MILRELGRTGLSVSILALGAVKLGRNTGVKYPGAFSLPDDESALALLAEAAALGINLIDTAPAYGSSEIRLGSLLPQISGSFLVATKVGEEFDCDTSRYDFSADHTHRSIERSLTALRRSTLDVVCIHSDGRDRQILQAEAALDTLRALKSQGVIHAIGLSAKSPDGVLAAIEYGLDVVMATVNPGYHDELPAIAEAHGAGLGVLVKKAMQSGHGDAGGLTWVARQRGVSSIVTGTLDPTHLRANVAMVCAIDNGANPGFPE